MYRLVSRLSHNYPSSTMKIQLTISALLFVSCAFGQSLKTVKAKSRYLLEQYEVRADNDTLRAGSYRKYLRDGNVLLEAGTYADNHRTGIWTFYDDKGKPELVYDYSASKVLENHRGATVDSLGVIQLAGKATVVRLTPPPTLLASMYQVSAILLRESRFPVHLMQAGLRELSYKVAATVSPTGTSYRVIASNPDKKLAQAAREWVALAFEGVQWLPGSYEGQPTTAMYMLPEIVLVGSSVIR